MKEKEECKYMRKVRVRTLAKLCRKLTSALPGDGIMKKDEIGCISLYHIILSISLFIRLIYEPYTFALGKDI